MTIARRQGNRPLRLHNAWFDLRCTSSGELSVNVPETDSATSSDLRELARAAIVMADHIDEHHHTDTLEPEPAKEGTP